MHSSVHVFYFVFFFVFFFNKFLHTAGVHEIAELIWYMNLYQYIGFYKSLKC